MPRPVLPIRLGLVNDSTLVTDTDAKRMASAVSLQVRRDFAPRWFRTPAPLAFYPSLAAVPADVWVLTLLDDSDEADALGYHDETPDGRVYARVFCRDTLTHGGTVLKGPDSVSVTLSHEVLELLADPNVNLWADDGRSRELALEVGDPVEASSYDIKGVTVSNFVLQSYFDARSRAGVYDFLGLLKKPWTMLPGGYQILRSAGEITQKFGRSVPAWKKEAKSFPAARTARRAAGATPGALTSRRRRTSR
jgi:hypothetical protein